MCSALETKRREQFNLSEAVQEKKKKNLWETKTLAIAI